MTMRTLALVVIGSLAMGCAMDRHRHDRPTRLQLGASSRHFASPPSDPVALRATGSPDAAGAPAAAATGTAQFTMTTRYHAYLGGELEAGAFLDRSGSNVAGAYGVAGAEHGSRFGSLAIEVAAGWRGLRYGLGEDTINQMIVEPRLRGQLWISPLLTLGAAAGTTLGDNAWMAGLYLGVHSNLFDAWKN